MDNRRPAVRRASPTLARFASAFLLSVAAHADAACTQADLAGTWNAYLGGSSFWQRCVIVIGTNGVVRPGTTCVTGFGDSYRITGGKIVLGRTCQGSGTITLQSPYLYDVVTASIEHATLDLTKSYASGVGAYNISQGFILNLIKR